MINLPFYSRSSRWHHIDLPLYIRNIAVFCQISRTVSLMSLDSIPYFMWFQLLNQCSFMTIRWTAFIRIYFVSFDRFLLRKYDMVILFVVWSTKYCIFEPDGHYNIALNHTPPMSDAILGSHLSLAVVLYHLAWMPSASHCMSHNVSSKLMSIFSRTFFNIWIYDWTIREM